MGSWAHRRVFCKRLAHLVLGGLVLLGCRTKEGPQKDQSAPSGSTLPHAPGTSEPISHVPVGPVTVGSLPGATGRDPALDPLPYTIELGPFRIDRNLVRDASGAPVTVSSQKAAEARCASEQGRLCTEIEWERACKLEFTIESGSIAEWTASSFGQGSELEGQPVVRQRRTETTDPNACARRRTTTKNESAGVRCCYGAPNAPRIKEPRDETPIFRVHPLDNAALVELLSSHPETRALAQGAALFPDDAAATVLARGPGDTKGFELTTAPIEWSPRAGVRLLVVAGKSEGDTAFVASFFIAPDKYVFASSFVMKKEKGPVALAYAPSIRPRVHFSTCWGCPGETGKALFREPESVVMLQP